MIFMQRTASKTTLRVVVTALMAALVFVGNQLSIPIPDLMGVTRIHLGNSMCLLAGLLFGGVSGGVASGIGGALYDLLNPVYISSAPYTFLSKFAMGFTCGIINRHKPDEKSHLMRTIIAAVSGQLVYIVFYLGKKFIEGLIAGGTFFTAIGNLATSALSSSINAVLSVIIAVPLYYALKKALSRTPIGSVIS